MKALIEKRNAIMDELEVLVNKATEETRALNEDEMKSIEEKKAEIRKIDETIKVQEEMKDMEKKEERKVNTEKEETRSQDEIDGQELKEIFEETRTAMNTQVSNEGGVAINEVLSKQIIKEVKDRSSVYSFFDGTSIKGTFKIPKKTGKGSAKWIAEGTTPNATPDATIPTLGIIQLGQHRLYAESAITQSMLNTESLDLKSFIVDDIAENMGDSIEEAIFNGTGTDQPSGIISGIKTSNKINLVARGVITIEDLKKCKGKLKKTVQKGAKWFMNADTLLEIDLLKDADGRPLLQPDLTKDSNYTLLGLPVEVTDAISTLKATGAKCVIILAHPKAYHSNTQKGMAINIYNDSAYKRAGLIGYSSDLYMDGKVKDEQRVSGIFNKA